MKETSPSDFTRQLGQLVQDAVQSGDYSQLKSAVDVTVREFTKSMKSGAEAAFKQKTDYTQRPNRPYYTPPPPRRQPAPRSQQHRPPVQRPMQCPARPPVAAQPVYNGTVLPAYRKVPGSAAGNLLLVFGILGLIGFLLATLAAVPAMWVEGWLSGAIVASCIFGALDVSCLLMIGTGSAIRGRVARFRRYLTVIGNARYYSLEHLAAATGVTKTYLVKDIRRMIRKGMFTDAYIDDQETCIMMDRVTYQQYLAAKQGMAQRRLQEEQARQQAASAPAQPEDSQKAAAKAAAAEGRSYIQQIKAANAAIPNEEISAKLCRLEDVTTRVFSYVEGHPDKLPEIRRFMSYYLPTTLKLVNAYRQFDSQPAAGRNIAAAKKEIQDILDTINTAFENLLDSLFEDDAMDISTDISALQIMLAQDGLTDPDFKTGE